MTDLLFQKYPLNEAKTILIYQYLKKRKLNWENEKKEADDLLFLSETDEEDSLQGRV